MRHGRNAIGSALGLLVLGLVSLVFIGGFSVWLNERARVNFDDLTAARTLSQTAISLRSGLQAAEASQRGYLATGNQVYLAPYASARDEAIRQMKQLRLQVDPASAQMLRLVGLVNEKLEEMSRSIELKRDRNDDDLTALLVSNRGKALMDEANIFLSAITRRAESRVTEATRNQTENFALLRNVTVGAAFLIIATSTVAVVLIARYVRDLRETKRQVEELNATLERKVGERTSELSQARDRAELLLGEVNHRVANSLAMVNAMVGLQARGLESPEAKQSLTETQARINAVAQVHKKLYTSKDVSAVALDDYLPSLLDQLEKSLQQSGHTAELYRRIAPITLPTDLTVNLGVVATEWVTNAFKYAYPDGAGQIRVTLQGGQGEPIELTVEDDGIGHTASEPARGTGLGTKLVTAVAQSMGAEVHYVPDRPGTTVRLIIPARAA